MHALESGENISNKCNSASPHAIMFSRRSKKNWPVGQHMSPIEVGHHKYCNRQIESGHNDT